MTPPAGAPTSPNRGYPYPPCRQGRLGWATLSRLAGKTNRLGCIDPSLAHKANSSGRHPSLLARMASLGGQALTHGCRQGPSDGPRQLGVCRKTSLNSRHHSMLARNAKQVDRLKRRLPARPTASNALVGACRQTFVPLQASLLALPPTIGSLDAHINESGQVSRETTGYSQRFVRPLVGSRAAISTRFEQCARVQPRDVIRRLCLEFSPARR